MSQSNLEDFLNLSLSNENLSLSNEDTLSTTHVNLLV